MNTSILTCNNTSVGVIVWHPDCTALLLQERAKPPYGLACPAGHVDPGESYEDAARRELSEETGLQTIELKEILSQRFLNACRRPGGNYHDWKVYQATVRGCLCPNLDEVKSMGWYRLDVLQQFSERSNDYQFGSLSDEEWQRRPGLELVWQDIFYCVDLFSDSFGGK